MCVCLFIRRNIRVNATHRSAQPIIQITFIINYITFFFLLITSLNYYWIIILYVSIYRYRSRIVAVVSSLVLNFHFFFAIHLIIIYISFVLCWCLNWSYFFVFVFSFFFSILLLMLAGADKIRQFVRICTTSAPSSRVIHRNCVKRKKNAQKRDTRVMW